MFGEPQHTAYDLHFRCFGIPVRVNPFFWLLGVLLASGSMHGDLQAWMLVLIAWLAALFVAVLVHELGHALVLRNLYGASPNIVLYGFGGIAAHQPTHRTMQTGPSIVISASGVIAGFLLVGLIVLFVMLLGGAVGIRMLEYAPYIRIPIVIFALPAEAFPLSLLPTQAGEVFHNFLSLTILICIFFGILNLLPIYPLDGGQIAREVFLAVDRRNGITYSLMLSILTAGGISVYELSRWVNEANMAGIPFMAIFFAFFAIQSYNALNSYRRF